MATLKYTATARSLHWLVALGIFAAFALALLFSDLPVGLAKLKLMNYHKWIGISVLLLAIVRLGWRWHHPPPPLPDNMTTLEKLASHWVHVLLYLLMFGVPLGGWIMSSAKGYPVVWLGLLPLPDLVAKNPQLADQIKDVHGLFGWILVSLALLHAAAALKHHFIARDDVLKRML